MQSKTIGGVAYTNLVPTSTDTDGSIYNGVGYKYQSDRGVSNRTLDKYRTYITSFYQWAVDEEYLERNPSKSIKPIKYEVKPR